MEKEKEREISVDTPKGKIVAKVIPDDNYPGISLEFVGPDGNPGALMTYSPTVNAVQLHMYCKEDPDGDPFISAYMSEPELSGKQEETLIHVLDEMVDRKMLMLEDKEDKIYASEISCDYDSRLSSSQINDISDAEDPGAKVLEIFDDMELHSHETFCFGDLYMDKGESEVLEPVKEAVDDWLIDHILFRLPYGRFYNQRFKVNVIFATDTERKKDFCSYTGLNEYGNYSGCLDEDNALMWVAKQFGKDAEVKGMLADISKLYTSTSYPDQGERGSSENPFVESCIQELENFSDCMGAFTLLLDMSLADFINLNEMVKTGEGTLTVGKETMCGIFDPWHGAGSLLEVKLPDKLEIPAGMIWSAWSDGSKKHGYDVDDVYGLIGSCWKNSYQL